MKGENFTASLLLDHKAATILGSLALSNVVIDLSEKRDEKERQAASTVIHLFDALAKANTPDLYQTEWELIAQSLEQPDSQPQMLPTLESIAENIISSVEDLNVRSAKIDSYLLSWKLAGFSVTQLFAIYYHVHQQRVAKHCGLDYSYPTIEAKP